MYCHIDLTDVLAVVLAGPRAFRPVAIDEDAGSVEVETGALAYVGEPLRTPDGPDMEGLRVDSCGGEADGLHDAVDLVVLDGPVAEFPTGIPFLAQLDEIHVTNSAAESYNGDITVNPVMWRGTCREDCRDCP